MSRRIRQGIVVLTFIALLAPAASAAPPAKHQDPWLSSWVPRIILKIQKVIRSIGSDDDLNIPPGNPKP